jgi:hypothetical protein
VGIGPRHIGYASDLTFSPEQPIVIRLGKSDSPAAHCLRTAEPAPCRSASQILEAILTLPGGAEIQLRAPVFKQYGEELDFVLTEVRKTTLPAD